MVPSLSSSFSSSSSSLFKKSHKPITSLNSLPNELLIEISSCVASSSLSDIQNLEQVSKSFHNHCNNQYILHNVPLHDVPLCLWSRDPEKLLKFSKFLKRFCKNGNPGALYHKGLTEYFHVKSDERKRNRGFKLLAEAANKGNQEAKYIYGLILLCLGDKNKQKGFKILSSLIKPLMSDTLENLDKLRYEIESYVLWNGKPVLKNLKRSYVRGSCKCDGRIEMVFITYSSSVCEICLWHRELEFFFNNIQE
ncbi:unnamed protein product [Cochlearia groenlandica]